MSVEINIDLDGVEDFKDAMERFDSAMQTHVHEQLASWAAEVKASATQRVPVKTGNLRSTIFAKVQEWVAEIGAEATYALYVEFGTRHMLAKPYIYPALQEYLPQLERVILDALEASGAEAGL